MNARIQVELGPVEETLLIPLLGRARETQKKRGLIHDEKAVEIVDRLDYDFRKWEGGQSLAGATLRTRLFDRYVQEFLQVNPGGTVVELGCGLNTRFDRVDNGEVRWFDLDLPGVISLRRRFFVDRPRCQMLAASALESDWLATVLQTGGPWMFVSEAVLIYLQKSDVRRVFTTLAEHFPGARIAFDTADHKMMNSQAKHDAMRHLSRDSWFRWACDDPKEVESWDAKVRLVTSKTFLDADDDLVDRFPWHLRLLTRFAPKLLQRRVSGYRLNLAVISDKDEAPRSA